MVLAAIAFGLLWLGGFWAAALIAGLSGAAMWEWRSITAHGGGPCALSVLPYVAAVAVGVVLAGFVSPTAAFAALATGAGIGVVLDTAAGQTRRAGWSVLGAGYLGAAGIAFLWLRETDPFGVAASFWIVMVVAGSDVGGYFAGRLVGGPLLWPAVSPKKTWAGLAGGLALAGFVGAIFSWGTTGTYYDEVCIVSAIAALLAQAGDLSESALKRRFGVKDSGRLLPGHGGVLDRLDGLTAAVLVAAAVLWWRDKTVFVWS